MPAKEEEKTFTAKAGTVVLVPEAARIHTPEGVVIHTVGGAYLVTTSGEHKVL